MNDALPKNSRLQKWALIAGIVVVLNLFFNYAIYLVYPEPKYETYCKQEQVREPIEKKDACVAAGGQWNANVNYGKQVQPLPPGYVPEAAGYCDTDFTCRKDYDAASQTYQRNVFVALVVLGVISLGAGVFLASQAGAVSTALSFGGVLSFIIASVRYWSYAQTWLQVAILGVALIALIWLGIKKFGKDS
ncbi:MAG: hypothetical protein AAB597_01165 [Patescibacteria group bacterium]